MTSTSPILIACVGNAMAGDDALGPAVAQRLCKLDLPNTEVFDLGAAPCDLLDELPGVGLLILVDAMCVPDQPDGQLVDVEWDAATRAMLAHDVTVSTHGLSITGQLELAAKLGMLPPRVRLIGLSISAAKAGLPMSHTVRAGIDLLVGHVLDHVRHHIKQPTHAVGVRHS